MNLKLGLRLLFTIMILGTFLYTYIRKQNSITFLRLEIPQASEELEEITQENTRLQFEIDQFENPVHLMDLARKPEFRHLKHPLVNDIIELQIK